jgi:hypothetical protein
MLLTAMMLTTMLRLSASPSRWRRRDISSAILEPDIHPTLVLLNTIVETPLVTHALYSWRDLSYVTGRVNALPHNDMQPSVTTRARSLYPLLQYLFRLFDK